MTHGWYAAQNIHLFYKLIDFRVIVIFVKRIVLKAHFFSEIISSFNRGKQVTVRNKFFSACFCHPTRDRPLFCLLHELFIPNIITSRTTPTPLRYQLPRQCHKNLLAAPCPQPLATIPTSAPRQPYLSSTPTHILAVNNLICMTFFI